MNSSNTANVSFLMPTIQCKTGTRIS